MADSVLTIDNSNPGPTADDIVKKGLEAPSWAQGPFAPPPLAKRPPAPNLPDTPPGYSGPGARNNGNVGTQIMARTPGTPGVPLPPNFTKEMVANTDAATRQQEVIQRLLAQARGDNSYGANAVRTAAGQAGNQALGYSAGVRGMGAGAALRAGQNAATMIGQKSVLDAHAAKLQEQRVAQQQLLQNLMTQRAQEMGLSQSDQEAALKRQQLMWDQQMGALANDLSGQDAAAARLLRETMMANGVRGSQMSLDQANIDRLVGAIGTGVSAAGQAFGSSGNTNPNGPSSQWDMSNPVDRAYWGK